MYRYSVTVTGRIRTGREVSFYVGHVGILRVGYLLTTVVYTKGFSNFDRVPARPTACLFERGAVPARSSLETIENS